MRTVAAVRAAGALARRGEGAAGAAALLRLGLAPLHAQRYTAKAGPGAPPKAPSGGVFEKFAKNIKSDAKDAELKDSVQKFEEKLTELNENASYRKAKEIMGKAKEDVLRQNSAILGEVKEKAAAIQEGLSHASRAAGRTIDGVSRPVRDLGQRIKPYVPDIGESEVVKRVGRSVSEAEEKILQNTNIYQYGGFKSKEQRERSRRAAEGSSEEGVPSPGLGGSVPGGSGLGEASCAANPEAGSSVVAHKESAWSKKWASMVDNSQVLQKFFGMKRSFDESNNIFVYFAREITNTIGDRVETESAQAMREIQLRDPSFHIEKYMRFVRESVIPEVLDAFVSGDLMALRMWSSEAMFNVLKANFEAQLKPNCHFEGKILDLRQVELVTCKLIDGTPIVVFSFNTQQITYMRNRATGEIVEGAEDAIDNVLYVIAMAKEAPTVPGRYTNSTTQDWRLIELAIRDKNGSW